MARPSVGYVTWIVSGFLSVNDFYIKYIFMHELYVSTDFIRPVCLPTMDITQDTMTNIRLEVAGWGAVSDTESFSNIKLHVDLPLATKQVR